MAAIVQAMAGRRLLVINPNTNVAVTSRVRQAARACARPGTLLDVVNPPAGPVAIETPADRAAAVPHVLALITRAGGSYDGYILACFDDIAIAEARRVLSAPVISMAEAGIRAAALHHARFDVVTTWRRRCPASRRWSGPMAWGSAAGCAPPVSACPRRPR